MNGIRTVNGAHVSTDLLKSILPSSTNVCLRRLLGLLFCCSVCVVCVAFVLSEEFFPIAISSLLWNRWIGPPEHIRPIHRIEPLVFEILSRLKECTWASLMFQPWFIFRTDNCTELNSSTFSRSKLPISKYYCYSIDIFIFVSHRMLRNMIFLFCIFALRIRAKCFYSKLSSLGVPLSEEGYNLLFLKIYKSPANIRSLCWRSALI